MSIGDPGGSTTGGFVADLHQKMMQASAEAALVERRLQEERKSDGLSGDLRHWQEAAEALHGALERARPALLAGGTLMDLCDRAGARLRELKAKSKDLDLDRDLDGCVEQWKALGLELSQLAGRQREPLVRLLQARKGRIDQTTAALAVARKSGCRTRKTPGRRPAGKRFRCRFRCRPRRESSTSRRRSPTRRPRRRSRSWSSRSCR